MANSHGQLPEPIEAANGAARPRRYEDHGGRNRQLEDRRFLPVSHANVHEGRLETGRHRRIARVNIFFRLHHKHGVSGGSYYELHTNVIW